MTIPKHIILILLILVSAGCASFKNDHEVRDSYWTQYGYVTFSYWKQPDGRIELWAWSEKESPDDFLAAEWRKYAQKLADGRQIVGSPSVRTHEYDQAAGMWDPQKMGEKHESKRAEGVVSFIP